MRVKCSESVAFLVILGRKDFSPQQWLKHTNLGNAGDWWFLPHALQSTSLRSFESLKACKSRSREGPSSMDSRVLLHSGCCERQIFSHERLREFSRWLALLSRRTGPSATDSISIAKVFYSINISQTHSRVVVCERNKPQIWYRRQCMQLMTYAAQ